MKRSMKQSLALFVVLLISLSVAGCKGGSEANMQTATPAPTAVQTAAGTDATAAPAVDQNIGTALAVRADKSIIVAAGWPTYIDPAVGSKASDSTAFTNMYDSLVFPKTDGTSEPLVATSWEANADSSVYTFHLRDDVVFHSGNKLTAHDVKFSMDRLLTIGEGYAYIFTGIVASTEVVDDYTVRFNLTKPTGNLAGMLIRLYILDEKLVRENIDPSGNYGENGDYAKSWLLTHDAGSGPYKVKEMKTEEYLIMEQFEDYWQGWEEGAPKLIKMLGGIDAVTGRTMLERGELEFSDDGQTAETLAALSQVEGLKLVRIPLSTNFNIALNTKLAPTDDVHVRRAMAYVLDYQAVIDNIYMGSTKPTGPIVKGLAAAALSEADMPYEYSLDKALAELKLSPYYDALMAGTMPLTLTYCTDGGSRQEKLALLMQAGMQALGVKIEITGKPFANMMTDAQTVETTPNASFVVFAPPYLDGGGYLKARYHSSSVGSWEQMEWLQDAEIDAMIEQAMTISDEATRNEMFKEIARKLVDLCPTIWVADLASSFVYRAEYITTLPSAVMYESGENFIYPTGYSSYYRNFRLK